MSSFLDTCVPLVFILLILGGIISGYVLVAIQYVRSNVWALDHNMGPSEGIIAGLVLHLLVLIGICVFIAFATKRCRLGVFVACSLIVAVVSPPFVIQRVLMSREYHHQCQSLGYNTRLAINRGGMGELYLFNNGVSVRALRNFSITPTGVSLQAALDNDAVLRSDLSLPVSAIEADLTVDGLNNSVWASTTSSAASRARIGSVRFGLNPAIAEFRLNESRIFRSWVKQNWWSNPNKILDLNGTEVARIIHKGFNSGHLAICGHLKNLDLSLLLAAMVQQFQKFGSECADVYGYASIRWLRCRRCMDLSKNGECQKYEIVGECVPEFREHCKGITY